MTFQQLRNFLPPRGHTQLSSTHYMSRKYDSFPFTRRACPPTHPSRTPIHSPRSKWQEYIICQTVAGSSASKHDRIHTTHALTHMPRTNTRTHVVNTHTHLIHLASHSRARACPRYRQAGECCSAVVGRIRESSVGVTHVGSLLKRTSKTLSPCLYRIPAHTSAKFHFFCEVKILT